MSTYSSALRRDVEFCSVARAAIHEKFHKGKLKDRCSAALSLRQERIGTPKRGSEN